MSDDNVTELPNANNGGGKKPKTPKEILGEIKGEWRQNRAKEFKAKAAEVMKEIELHKKNLKLAEAKLTKITDEFVAENAE